MTDQDGILADFLEYSIEEEHLLPSHVALFTAIHHLLKISDECIHVKITRKKVMRLAKINSVSTYHRCINELVKLQYITYQPSFDHYTGTMVTFKQRSLDCAGKA